MKKVLMYPNSSSRLKINKVDRIVKVAESKIKEESNIALAISLYSLALSSDDISSSTFATNSCSMV